MINTNIKNYDIKYALGQGGMSVVYLAFDNKFMSNVAVKVLNKQYVHNKNIRKRFIAEARNMFRMSHPHIVKVTDLIDENDTVAFVMEFVEGETLKEHLERNGKLNDADITRIFSQMLEAVGYVHEQKLVHRDIKPSNFMLDKHGNVKLMDFGIAKNTDASSAEYTQTGTGMQMGTPMYMSPEQITETKSVTAQSDIYSLGVVLWQMVMGRKPYDVKTLSTFQLQLKVVQESLPLAHRSWDTLISRSTKKIPDERFAFCSDFLNTLKTLKQDKVATPIQSSKISTGEDETILYDNTSEIKKSITVSIGKQIWMSENLDIAEFRNGDVIPEATTIQAWYSITHERKACWCYYNFDESMGKIYGKLYNYYAVIDKRILAPHGWRIPGTKDWMDLIDILGGIERAGNKVRQTKEGGYNSSGFSALPGGLLGRPEKWVNHKAGIINFEKASNHCQWWTYDSKSKDEAFTYLLKNKGLDGHYFEQQIVDKNNGHSVRCIMITQ